MNSEITYDQLDLLMRSHRLARLRGHGLINLYQLADQDLEQLQELGLISPSKHNGEIWWRPSAQGLRLIRYIEDALDKLGLRLELDGNSN